MSLADTLRDLAAFLVRDPLTVDDVVARLGPIAKDHGRGGSLELASTDPRFCTIELWRDPEAGAPYHLELEIAEDARVPVAELTAAFGDFQDATPRALGAQKKLRFEPIARGDAFVAQLSARIEGPRDRPEEGTVTGVAILRDVRVD